MKKLLIGLTLLTSMSSFANTVKDLTWSFATYTNVIENDSNRFGRIIVTGYNIVEDLANIRCIKKTEFDYSKEGAYMTSEHNSEHKTIKIEALDYNGEIQNSVVILQAGEDEYTTGEIVASVLSLGFADDYIRGNKLNKRAIGYMNDYLSSLNSQVPSCSN
ncbi:hypothetical protein HBN50_13565 [Halobacteriovorax sp. GB3]|uniref:hypothetical protein n=1 Tax=Halobacteriovorax sp. GB3 TaxID=2719615 RepID=UPI002361F170|nr:hypothetical protein [Halobacteriovorax sp. GB3]MDD0854135.1 hypothetical protein [Halobacteriovorax sp. GB3]